MGTAVTVHPRDIDRAALQLIAEGVTELAGFELVAISVVHEGFLHTVAVAGDEAAAEELSQLRAPVDVVLAALTRADDWGPLKFVPHERGTPELDAYSFIPETPVVDAPGAWHPHDLLCALLRDDAGELRGVLSVDVPRNGLRPDDQQRKVLELYARQAGRAVIMALERRELEHGLRREQAIAEKRAQLIHVLSHQLQNPLAAITGNVELLLDEVSAGDPSERGLRAIERATQRIASMIEDLLALARVNDPERPLMVTHVDLTSLLRGAVELLSAEAARRGVVVELGTSEPMVVAGDAHELDDLASNLVSNAVKYSRDGGRVSVSLRTATGQGRAELVELCVVDHGIGISADDQPRLFEEFFRSADQEVRDRPGTGLGLAIVERVVQRHGGRIEIDSELGDGTTVRVLLPLATR